MVLETLLDVNLPLVLVTGLALLVTLVIKAWLQAPVNLPPVPARPYPILGHLPYLKDDPRGVITKWAEKTGNIFTVYMGSTRMIMVAGLDLMKEFLLKQSDHINDRPDNMYPLIEGSNIGVFSSSGQLWQEQRSVTLSILRNFGMGKNSLAEKFSEEVSKYLDELARQGGKPFNAKLLTYISISNNICSIIVGHRFEYDDPFFIKFIQNTTDQVVAMGSTSALKCLPWLKFLPGDLFGGKRFREIDKAFTKHFSEHFIREQSPGGGSEHVESMITAYLAEMRKRQKAGQHTYLAEENLSRVIIDLFLAGSDSTSTTIMWFMYHMLHNPTVQAKIYSEIENVVGRDRTPTLQDRPQMTYLNAAIMETLRIGSIVPFGGPRVATKDATIGGYTIPKGSHVSAFLDSVLLSPKVWGDPNTFRPERFLNADGDLDKVLEEFIPFSMGKRVCLGESLAKMELFLYLSALIQRFELQPTTPGHPPVCKGKIGVVFHPEDFELRFIARDQ